MIRCAGCIQIFPYSNAVSDQTIDLPIMIQRSKSWWRLRRWLQSSYNDYDKDGDDDEFDDVC